MRLFRSLCDRFLNSSRADFTSSELGSDLVELTAAGAGSAAGCEASVAGCEEEGTETGTEAARDADTETDTVNNKARNWVAIFFILSILVEQIYGGILQIVALHAIKRPQIKESKTKCQISKCSTYCLLNIEIWFFFGKLKFGSWFFFGH